MKRFLLIMIVLVSLVLLSGCQSDFEKSAKDIQNIKITVDQQTMNEVNQGIQNFKDGN